MCTAATRARTAKAEWARNWNARLITFQDRHATCDWFNCGSRPDLFAIAALTKCRKCLDLQPAAVRRVLRAGGRAGEPQIKAIKESRFFVPPSLSPATLNWRSQNPSSASFAFAPSIPSLLASLRHCASICCHLFATLSSPLLRPGFDFHYPNNLCTFPLISYSFSPSIQDHPHNTSTNISIFILASDLRYFSNLVFIWVLSMCYLFHFSVWTLYVESLPSLFHESRLNK